MTPADALTLRPADEADAVALWAMLEPVFRAGDTYAIDPEISRADALAYWCGGGHRAFIAEDAAGAPVGTYYIGRNQGGGGAHVCNCGFASAAEARGRGVAREMLRHALATARKAGYRAMQFNFVVTTNSRAITIWRDHGFEVVGRLPGAFDHPRAGYVDALVMYKQL